VASPIDSARPTVLLMTRAGCHLCVKARVLLEAVLVDRAGHGLPPVSVREVDIDTDGDLRARFDWVIPVLVIGDRELLLALDAEVIRAFVAAAFDGGPLSSVHA
jgi:hypothetical protein